MRGLFQICGGLAFAAALLVGCESLWVGYKTPNPESCEAPGYGCSVDEVCNPATRKCESRQTTLLDLSTTDSGTLDGGPPSTCVGPVSYSCGSQMFCVQAPLSAGPTKKLSAVSESDIWAVSDNRILHYDGRVWNTVTTCGAQSAFVDVFAASNSDVWFLEGRRILRLQGSTFSEIPTGLSDPNVQLRAVYGISGRIWFVGTGGTILQWDGSQLTPQTSGTTGNLNSVWGPDGQNLWAVGDNGTALRYNGTSWQSVTTGTTANLNGVHGRSASAIVAVGTSGTVLNGNGTTFTALTPLLGASDLLSVSIGSDGSGWIVAQSGTLYRSMSGSWAVLSQSGLLARPNYDVWHFGANSAVMVGGNSRSVRSRWNGMTWVDSFDEIMPAPQAMAAVTTPSAGAMAVGQGLDGNTYSITSDFSTLGPRLQVGAAGWTGQALWVDPAAPAGRLAWVVGKGGLSYAFDGTAWNQRSTSVSDDLVSICGANSTAIWAVGSDAAKQNGRVIAWNGSTWVTVGGMSLGGTPLTAVTCAGGQAYVTGKGMTIQTCTSSACTLLPTNGVSLGAETAYAAWSTPSASGTGTDVWIAGTRGNIYRYQSMTDLATKQNSGTTQTLRSIFGKTHSDFYVVGDGGTIIKWNGTSFSPVRSDTTASLTTGVILASGATVIGGPSSGWLQQVP